MSENGPDTSNDDELVTELEHYKELCRKLAEENTKLREENAKMRDELLALKTTVTAVVARSIDARADSKKMRYKKSGRRDGHEGTSRRRPEHIDATVGLDQTTCHRCGGGLSEKPTHAYTRVVEDIVPARVVVTEYIVRRRYCCRCRKQVSPAIPNVIDGASNERFGLRLMLLVVSLKLLGMSYEKIGSLLKLLFNLDVTEAAMVHCVISVAKAFGPRYEELKQELRREASLGGDETSWRIKGKNHWLWTFVGKWSVIYEVAKSRGKEVPKRVLGDYGGTIISDSWPAWNHVGKKWQRCLVHYLREIKDTLKYKSPGKEFFPFAKKFRRMLRDSIRIGEKVTVREERLRAKARLEARVDALIASYSPSSSEKSCKRFVKRLKRERDMLFTFLEQDGVDWNNNAAERALRPSVVIRKITYGNQSDEGAAAHAVLMSIRETCSLRKENFFDYAMGYLNKPTSQR